MPRFVRVPVSPLLTAPTPLPDVPGRPLFCDDLERIAQQRAEALTSCNADKAAIRDQDTRAGGGQ